MPRQRSYGPDKSTPFAQMLAEKRSTEDDRPSYEVVCMMCGRGLVDEDGKPITLPKPPARMGRCQTCGGSMTVQDATESRYDKLMRRHTGFFQ